VTGRAGPPAPGEFDFRLPTRIRFGVGVRRDVGPTAAAIGRRAVLVTGASFESNAAAADVLASFTGSGVIVERVVAHGEPDDAAVLELARRLESFGAESVVGVGGGSVLDLVKAAALRPSRDRLAAMLAGARTEEAGLPVIALPTTAGSGAEVSHAAIVLDRASTRKRGVRGPGVAARHAIVDPELMIGAPPAVTAASGFDAIAHALETSASRAASDLTILLASEALPRLLDAIPRLQGSPGDADAMGSAAYAALLMGINLANSTTCLPHRLQYPIGARTGTGHAHGVAALMPAWLERTAAVAPAPLARLARASGLAAGDATADAAARSLVDRIRAHMDATGMRLRLRDLGIGRDDIDPLLSAVEGTLTNDPGPTAIEDLRQLYVASL
jgi:alcohol dehydrogenase class IV